MITCILLAAGFSSRFGSPKPLALIYNKTIIDIQQQKLTESLVAEIIVVLGAHKERIEPHLLKHKKIKVVYNKDYILGQTSSFQAGLRAADKRACGFMLLPVDYPIVQLQTFDAIVRAYQNTKPKILIPTFEGRKGHPPVFSSSLKEEILGLNPEEGLNTLAKRHAQEAFLFSTDDEGVMKTFNTREELETII